MKGYNPTACATGKYLFVSKISLRSLDSEDLKKISATQTYIKFVSYYGRYNFPVLTAAV